METGILLNSPPCTFVYFLPYSKYCSHSKVHIHSAKAHHQVMLCYLECCFLKCPPWLSKWPSR